MRLLVVEDEKKLNELIRKKLEKEYYGVDSCFDGEEAVRYVEGTEYDAIILDIMLPKLDGFEVIKRIRKKKNKVPILLLTARDNIDDKVKGLDYGADDYLVKPFIFEELMAECYKEPTQRQRTKHSTRFEKVFFKNKKYILNYVTDIVGIIGYWLIYMINILS